MFDEGIERGRDKDRQGEGALAAEASHTRPCEVCRRAKKGAEAHAAVVH